MWAVAIFAPIETGEYTWEKKTALAILRPQFKAFNFVWRHTAPYIFQMAKGPNQSNFHNFRATKDDD